MKAKWKVDAPAPDPFEPGAVYQVRHLTVGRTGNASVRAGLAAAAEEAMRLAPANLDRSRSLVLFEWDLVYSKLTVVFTNARREDARDVLKVFCKGWDGQHQKKSNEWMAPGWMMTRKEAVRAWLDAIVVRAKARWKKHLPGRAVRFGFKDHDRKQVQTLGEGRFEDPYAGR